MSRPLSPFVKEDTLPARLERWVLLSGEAEADVACCVTGLCGLFSPLGFSWYMFNVSSAFSSRSAFLAAHIPLFLYPFLHTVSKTRPFEYLRLTSLGVIGKQSCKHWEHWLLLSYGPIHPIPLV